MEANCQWKNLVCRLSPSRGLGRKINEQGRSSIESEDKSRCSDRYFGVFYHNSRNCTNGNAYCKIHTIMRLGRILGPVSSFLIRHFLYLRAICAWPSQSLLALHVRTTCTDLRWRDIIARVIAYVTPARKEIYCYSKL